MVVFLFYHFCTVIIYYAFFFIFPFLFVFMLFFCVPIHAYTMLQYTLILCFIVFPGLSYIVVHTFFLLQSTCCIFVSDFVSVCFFSRMPDWCSGSNFKHRWGGVRFKRTMLQLEPDQKQFIIDNGFESFLSLNNFKVHSRLAEWIMQKMNPEICEFRFRGKVIVFDKLLVQKITGLNDGDLPVKLSGANSEVVKEIRTLYHPYFVSNRLGTGMCEKLLLSLHDEEKFLRTFILYLLATILCPATGNYVNLDYVHSLVDVQMWS